MDRNENHFLFRWKIRNFKTIAKNERTVFISPLFVSNYTERFKWKLLLDNNGNECKLRLTRYGSGNGNTPLHYSFNFVIICNDGENVISENVRNDFGDLHNFSVIFPFSFKDILKDEKKYLNGDSLIIHISMWKDTGVVFDVIKMSADTEHFNKKSNRNQEHSFIWNIADFRFGLEIEKKISLDYYKFLFRMSILNYQNVEVAVQSLCNEKFEVDCEVFFSKSKIQKENFEIQDRQNNDYVKVLRFVTSSKTNKSEAIKKNFLTDGVLSLHFKVTLMLCRCYKSFVFYEFFPSVKPSSEEEIATESDDNCSANITCTSQCTTLRSEWKQLYISKKLADITLMVNGKLLRAHKLVLVTRSPVFFAMFEQDMLEITSGIIDVKDVDFDTLDAMILFMYCDQIREINYEKAKKLFIVADKYEINSLKKQCSIFLRSCLSVENVCEILLLSDMIFDEELQNLAIEFFIPNSKSILITEEWDKLEKSNSKLGYTLFKKLALNMQKIYQIL